LWKFRTLIKRSWKQKQFNCRKRNIIYWIGSPGKEHHWKEKNSYIREQIWVAIISLFLKQAAPGWGKVFFIHCTLNCAMNKELLFNHKNKSMNNKFLKTTSVEDIVAHIQANHKRPADALYTLTTVVTEKGYEVGIADNGQRDSRIPSWWGRLCRYRIPR
jgi:hypothetical protein